MKTDKNTTEEQSKGQGLLYMIENIDKRILYLLLIVSIAFPLLYPMNLTSVSDSLAKGSYDAIKGLPPGSVILYAYDIQAKGLGEYQPAHIALTNLVMSCDVKIIFINFRYPTGPQIFQTEIMPYVDTHDKVYGEDWVELGYFTGFETGMASFAKDIKGFTSLDYFGNKIEDLPLMNDIETADDLDFLIGSIEYLRQFQAPYGIRATLFEFANGAVGMMPYVLSGQYEGMVVGVVGAADLELRMGKPGMGAQMTDVISFSQLVYIVALILGNFGYFYRKSLGKKEVT